MRRNLLLVASVQGCVPDARRAATAKDKANEAYRLGQLHDAAVAYTDSVRFGEEVTNEGRTLASRSYANRALVHMHLGELTAAVEDATAAIDCDPRFDKAWYRRAAALESLGRHRQAAQDASTALQLAQDEGSAASIARLASRLQSTLLRAAEQSEPRFADTGPSASPHSFTMHDLIQSNPSRLAGASQSSMTSITRDLLLRNPMTPQC